VTLRFDQLAGGAVAAPSRSRFHPARAYVPKP
jgi:hypothetical protein